MPALAHCMYVEANLDTVESSNYLESCAARHFTNQVFSFLVVTDAFRALECLSHMNFLCIFLHRELPGLSGTEALNILRTSNFRKSVILVVEEGDDTTDAQAMQLGFDGVLRKPYSSLQLCEIMATCTRSPDGEHQSAPAIEAYEI